MPEPELMPESIRDDLGLCIAVAEDSDSRAIWEASERARAWLDRLRLGTLRWLRD